MCYTLTELDVSVKGKKPKLARFRHTFVSRMAQKGVPRAYVEELVGATSQVVARYYTHLDEAHLRDALERL